MHPRRGATEAMEEDPTTQELRLDQLQREVAERKRADDTPLEEETAQHERRAERAAYLRGRLEQRAEAERQAAVDDAADPDKPPA